MFAWNSTHSRQFPCLGHEALGHAQSCFMSAMIANRVHSINNMAIRIIYSDVLGASGERMGFLSDLKTAAKNTSDRADQEVATQKLKSEISSAKSDNESAYSEIGKLYYQNVKDPSADFAGKSKELVDRIDANLARIEELNKKIEETIAEHKANRENNRAEAAAEEARRKAEKEAAAEAAKKEE